VRLAQLILGGMPVVNRRTAPRQHAPRQPYAFLRIGGMRVAVALGHGDCIVTGMSQSSGGMSAQYRVFSSTAVPALLQHTDTSTAWQAGISAG
jgi:hypothetical protein